MCDFFWQKMENDQGDLADIVRASGRAGPSSNFEIPIADWQFPLDPVSCFPGPSEEYLGDPFADKRDLLLHELPGTGFFDAPDVAAELAGECGQGGGGLLAHKMLGGEVKRPCNVFSRMLQISPGTAKASPLSPRAIRPSPIIASPTGCAVDNGSLQISSPRTPGIKRRKSQAKKVVCIPAPASSSSRPTGEVVPSDLWAWRKYGQKPIKGSPYPRGYYRCSSSKGCSARKQVERSRTDPNMLVITYTSEHNHPWPTQRNALAGSTRSQTPKNSSLASKNSPRNQKPAANSKEEQKETTPSSTVPSVKEEAGEMEKPMPVDATEDSEFNQAFHQRYQPIIPDSGQSDDFFADLAELESDPMNLIFSREMLAAGKLDEEERDNKALDPLNFFDWSGSSFGEAKKGL